jgi:hypothetical protein
LVGWGLIDWRHNRLKKLSLAIVCSLVGFIFASLSVSFLCGEMLYDAYANGSQYQYGPPTPPHISRVRPVNSRIGPNTWTMRPSIWAMGCNRQKSTQVENAVSISHHVVRLVRHNGWAERLVRTTSQLAGDNRPSMCAGINRHEAEDERSLRERNSEPLGPEFCAVLREKQGEA